MEIKINIWREDTRLADPDEIVSLLDVISAQIAEGYREGIQGEYSWKLEFVYDSKD